MNTMYRCKYVSRGILFLCQKGNNSEEGLDTTQQSLSRGTEQVSFGRMKDSSQSYLSQAKGVRGQDLSKRKKKYNAITEMLKIQVTWQFFEASDP